MDDLVKESSCVIPDLVFKVANEQIGRKRNFMVDLSNALMVAGDYQVKGK